MTTKAALSPAERDALRPIADQWKLDYQLALDDMRERPEGTLDQWIDTAWEKGFLDQLAPVIQNPEVRNARALMGRPAWRDRTDPVLYWRIQYALEYYRFSMHYTMAWGAAAEACGALLIALTKIEPRLVAFFPKMKHHGHRVAWQQRICELLMERARQALRALNATPHDPTFRKDSTGIFRGIPCVIDSICDDGTLWLKPDEPGPENSNILAVHDFMNGLTPDGKGLCPSLIDPALFIQAKGRDH